MAPRLAVEKTRLREGNNLPGRGGKTRPQTLKSCPLPGPGLCPGPRLLLSQPTPFAASQSPWDL